MRHQRLLLLTTTMALGLLALTAIAQSEAAEGTTPQAAESEGDRAPRRAIAVLQPTQGNNTTGVVTFEETPAGLRMRASVRGLPSGEHAYHVHVYGDCSAPDATSAGPHYRFGPGDTGITGNLGELAGAGGRAQDAKVIELAQLHGERSIIGRSVVVHRKGNDPSQPPEGGAGARIACGVIGLDEASRAASPSGAAPSGAPPSGAPPSGAPPSNAPSNAPPAGAP